MRHPTVIAVAVLAWSASASADPMLAPPAGWSGGRNAELAAQASSHPHFGGGDAKVVAEQYQPATPGVVLMVVRASKATSSAAPDAAGELATLRDHGPTVEVVENNEHVDDTTHVVEMRVSWRDTSTDTTDTSRTLVAATKDWIYATTAECMAASGADTALRDACKAALATLDVGVPADTRVALVPSPTTTMQGHTVIEPGMSSPPATTPHRPAIPPIAVEQDEPPSDKRPLIVGAGLVVLAAVFWWNRKRRARFAAEDRGARDDR